MGRRVSKPTFAEIVEDAAQAPTKTVPLRYGRVNRAGVLASPDGAAFARERGAVDPPTARELVRAGALVAVEACGCGGDYCEPEWVPIDDLPKLAATEPRRVGGSAPMWIDIWTGPTGSVVFLHGDYVWGALGHS